MYAISELKQLGVPIEIKNIKELQYTRVIYPEHSVVVLSGAVRVVVQCGAEVRRPVDSVQLAVVASPAEVRPRVLELQKLYALSMRRTCDLRMLTS